MKLTIDNFKAFKTSFSLEYDTRNILIYGENGVGKSSIFDALKLYYFKNRVLKENIQDNVVGRERLYEEQRILEEYKNDIAQDMDIKIGDISFSEYVPNGMRLFLISYKDLEHWDFIHIKEFVEHAYFTGADSDVAWISPELIDLIVEEVNAKLKNFFWIDSIRLHKIDNTGRCAIEQTKNKMRKQFDLSNYFNESTLHIVMFLILINVAVWHSDDNNLLVFDDCFNSLDMPNRSFMVEYILLHTKKLPKVVLTHNTGFYNLFKHINSVVNSNTDTWTYLHIREAKGEHYIVNDSGKSIKDISNKLKGTDPIAVGNELRQKFEEYVYKLAYICKVGEMQEAKDLLDKLCSPNSHVYLSVNGDFHKDIYCLLDEIYSMATCGCYRNLDKRVKKKIEEFREHDFLKELKPVLEELRLMQKVALHPASHGREGIPSVSQKEINVALALLEIIEKAINAIEKKTKAVSFMV